MTESRPHDPEEGFLRLVSTSQTKVNIRRSRAVNQPSPSYLLVHIFITGASLAISGFCSDFVGDIVVPTHTLHLGGMANGLLIEGIGIVKWTFTAGDTTVAIHSQCYYVPYAKVRLISPQRLFRKSKGVLLKTMLHYHLMDVLLLSLSTVPSVICPYHMAVMTLLFHLNSIFA